MATKDISDVQVCEACRDAHERYTGEFSLDVLVRMTGQPEKVCYRAMERAHRRRFIEYGVSLRSAFLDERGRAFPISSGNFAT